VGLSERIRRIEADARTHALNPPELVYNRNTRYAYDRLYADRPAWERYVRSNAYGLVNQPVFINDDDHIIGRYYLKQTKLIDDADVFGLNRQNDVGAPDIEARRLMNAEIARRYPAFFSQVVESSLCNDFMVYGHVSYSFEQVLHHGVDGMRDLCRRYLERTRDPKSVEFYNGVLIMLDALLEWNDRHVAELQRRGRHDLATLCGKVPRRPAQTFQEAVQSLNMLYFAVSRETACGTYGPGWLDYHLWPYLERDLAAGRCSMAEAKELVAELFIRFDERVALSEMHNDTVMVGGSHPNGVRAINPLTYAMVEVIMELGITDLLVYLKMPANPPREYVELAANYLYKSGNRGMILSDEAIAGALAYRGMPYTEALGYTANGCMEIGGPANNSDLLFSGWHNIPKFVELAITGGRCLVTGRRYDIVSFEGLESYRSFEGFYADLVHQMKRILHLYFETLDIMSEYAESYRPVYLASSLVNDCLLRGRNMHGGGARYHDYGTAPVGMPNAADSLFAIKKAVFEDRTCSARELVRALEADYNGYEALRLALKSTPKYGRDNGGADDMAVRFINSVCDIYESYTNRWGGAVKPVVMTFIWANQAGSKLGATADGNHAGTAVAQGVTPQSAAMTKGVTAAIVSNTRIPYHRLGGGASTMWDFDPAWINQELLQNLMTTFFDLGGQMFQGNTSVDVAELMRAKEDPRSYEHLIVRVGGFSARFAYLTPDLQDDIIKRYRHSA
jgi:trans-4-hydroxy-L-proline dehydratase